MWCDIALAYDPVTRACDVVFAAGGVALDTTPATPVLISLGTDRRAHPDDALPDTAAVTGLPASLSARRGWAADAFDALGRRIGSRLWLLSREKQSEATRLRAADYVAEALAWIGAERGITPQFEVGWARAGVLAIVVYVGTRTIRVMQPVV